jgi:RNA recognition motif-containing protein
MNLYISNLGEQITDESLRAIFATYGVVHSANIAKDQFTGFSRGFAFIEMPNDNEALAAISRINGSVLNGRSVSVEKAKPKIGFIERNEARFRSPKP